MNSKISSEIIDYPVTTKIQIFHDFVNITQETLGGNNICAERRVDHQKETEQIIIEINFNLFRW